MQEGPTIRIGLVAKIAEYAITIVGDDVTVTYRDGERAGERVTTQEVKHLAQFVGRARHLRVALAQFPDFEVVIPVRSRPGWLRLCRQHPGAGILGVGGRAR